MSSIIEVGGVSYIDLKTKTPKTSPTYNPFPEQPRKIGGCFWLTNISNNVE